jgi:ATP-dependent Clp endopeptidase proteolytic subunit ClpP
MKWYEIKDKAEKAEIWIYEMIGKDFWTGDGITAKEFQKDLSELKAGHIDLHINSPGGEVFDGITIYNLLKQHPAKITTYIDGIAASIASVIALAGDKVYMAANALYMMHNPFGLVMGNSGDMRKMADVLDKVRGTMTTTYVEKSGKTEQDVNALLDAETWMTANEAVAAGFVDEITDKMDMAACAKFVPIMAEVGFKRIPRTINPNQTPTAREAERALRDVGFSEKLAKVILAEGLRDSQRDVDIPTNPTVVKAVQRDVDPPKPKKDRVSDLLTRAEVVAPSTTQN